MNDGELFKLDETFDCLRIGNINPGGQDYSVGKEVSQEWIYYTRQKIWGF